VATVVVGDIHGEIDALDDLLAQVAPLLEPDDTLVFLGDYIDRGPDSRAVIERILELRRQLQCRVVTLIGNHEQWLLRTLNDFTRHSWIVGMEAFETISSYSPQAAMALRDAMRKAGPSLFTTKVALPYEQFFRTMAAEHIAFLRGLQLHVRTPDVVCVHAGVALLDDPLDAADQEVFTWGPDGFPQAYAGKERVAYGHWDNAELDGDGRARPRILGNRTFGLDTISHGILTAMRFPDGVVFQGRS